MSLGRRDSPIALKRTDSAPDLIYTKKEFSPFKKDDYDDENWDTARNIVYTRYITKPSLNPFQGFSKFVNGPRSLARESGKLFGAISQFFPRRKRTGRRSKKRKRKRKQTKKRRKKKISRKKKKKLGKKSRKK